MGIEKHENDPAATVVGSSDTVAVLLRGLTRALLPRPTPPPARPAPEAGPRRNGSVLTDLAFLDD